MDNETNFENTMDNASGTIQVPQENEFANMTHAIVEWRRLQQEMQEMRQQVRERTKRAKALEEVILRIMKTNNIGALDLKNTGGRILFKRQKRQAGLGQKNLHKLIADFLKSDQMATEAIQFINQNREVFTKESLSYEKTA
jgi:hypothetical protein